MKHVIRPATLIVAAMVGSAIVLLVLIGAAKSLTVFSSSPADFLPADQTDLVIHSPSTAMLDRWSSILSPSASVPTNAIHTIAHLQTDHELSGTITFTKQATHADHNIGAYGIEVSDPLLLPLITSQAAALQKHSAYQTLQKYMPHELSWAYLSRKLLQPSTNLETRILRSALLGKAQQLAYVSQENKLTLATHQPNRRWHQVRPTVPTASGTILAWNYANGAEAWNSLRTTLPRNDATIIEGLIRAQIIKFGTDVSFTHTILPLMEQPGTLQLTQTGGTVHVLLSGSAPDTNKLNAHLETLHQTYASTLPTTRVTHRVLDQRFSSTDLRHDQDVISQTNEQVGEYWVSGTKHIDDTDGLFTATRGTDFLISTNRNVLLYALAHDAPLMPNTGIGVRTAELVLVPNAVAELTKNVLPSLSALLQTSGVQPLFFFSEWKADVQSHTIQLPNNTKQLLDSLL